MPEFERSMTCSCCSVRTCVVIALFLYRYWQTFNFQGVDNLVKSWVKCLFIYFFISWFWACHTTLGKHHLSQVSFIMQSGSSWSWSYGSWIDNYLCNQCLSLLTLWVRIHLRRGVLDTKLCDKVCQWLAAGRCFLWVLRFRHSIKLTATIYLKYCWKWR